MRNTVISLWPKQKIVFLALYRLLDFFFYIRLCSLLCYSTFLFYFIYMNECPFLFKNWFQSLLPHQLYYNKESVFTLQLNIQICAFDRVHSLCADGKHVLHFWAMTWLHASLVLQEGGIETARTRERGENPILHMTPIFNTVNLYCTICSTFDLPQRWHWASPWNKQFRGWIFNV